MKHIPLSKVGKIACGILILGALIMVIGCCVRGAGGLALVFAGLIVWIGAVIFILVFQRCPRCGGVVQMIGEHYCPHCGHFLGGD